jgi:hypothetical protein
MPPSQSAGPSDHEPGPAVLRIVARQIEPGDYLPPQAALDGTRHQQDGFTVGCEDRDVLPGLAVVPGRMLLYGPAGTLDSVSHDAPVAVRRDPPTGQDDGEAS